MIDRNLFNDNKLIDMVKQSIIFDKFKRKSGGFCEYYVNGRRMVLNSDSVLICSNKILDIAINLGVTHVGGEVASALPLVGAIITLAALRGYKLTGFFIREAEKEHGLSNIIEGEFTDKSSLLLVDDVIGKGSVAVRCCRLLRDKRLNVSGFCAIVDRNEGAYELLQAEGVKLYSLCTINSIREWIENNISLKRKINDAFK